MNLKLNAALSRETLFGQSVPDKRYYKETFKQGSNFKNRSSINLALSCTSPTADTQPKSFFKNAS